MEKESKIKQIKTSGARMEINKIQPHGSAKRKTLQDSPAVSEASVKSVMKIGSSASLKEEKQDPSVAKTPLYSNQSGFDPRKITSWSVFSMLKYSFFKWMETITGKYLML
jgi:hypothetical protein